MKSGGTREAQVEEQAEALARYGPDGLCEQVLDLWSCCKDGELTRYEVILEGDIRMAGRTSLEGLRARARARYEWEVVAGGGLRVMVHVRRMKIGVLVHH